MIPVNFNIMPVTSLPGPKKILKNTTFSMNFLMAIPARVWVRLTKPGGRHW